MRHLAGTLQKSQAISISAADQRESRAPRKPRQKRQRQRAEPQLRARFLESECESGGWRTVSVVIWRGGRRCRAPFFSEKKTGVLTRANYNNYGLAVKETTFERPGSSGEPLKCCPLSKNSRMPAAASLPTAPVIAGKRLPSLLFTR